MAIDVRRKMEMEKGRLNRLADFLENEVQPILDGAQFDMGVWNHAPGMEESDTVADLIHRRVALEEAQPELSRCGFEGCAIGWSAFCPDLEVPVMDSLSPDPWYRWGDICEYFGLTYEQARHLFCPDSYDYEEDEEGVPTFGSIPEVVGRIRGLVEAGYLDIEVGL